MKTPLSKERLQNHLTYSWWKYALVAILSAAIWSIIFTVTAYRPPEEKKIVIGVYGFGNQEVANAYMAQVQQEYLPDMEQMEVVYLTPDELSGDMVLSIRVAARECDVYILPRQQFQSYAGQSAFMALDEVLPEMVADLQAKEISLSRGWRAIADTESKHLYGIPCAELPGIKSIVDFDYSDMYISLFFETGNDENVIRFMDIFIRDMLEEPVSVELPAQ